MLEGDYHIVIDKKMKPVQSNSIRVPIALVEKLRTTIEKMVKNKIIVKENNPSEWISNMAIHTIHITPIKRKITIQFLFLSHAFLFYLTFFSPVAAPRNGGHISQASATLA